jgi:hypothetical protein
MPPAKSAIANSGSDTSINRSLVIATQAGSFSSSVIVVPLRRQRAAPAAASDQLDFVSERVQLTLEDPFLALGGGRGELDPCFAGPVFQRLEPSLASPERELAGLPTRRRAVAWWPTGRRP